MTIDEIERERQSSLENYLRMSLKLLAMRQEEQMRLEAEEAEEEEKHQFEIEECLTKINRYATITLS